MKSFRFIILFLIVFSVPSYAQEPKITKNIKPEGETELRIQARGLNVKLMLKTHEVDIGRPSDGRPVNIEKSCTYSKYPCSIVLGVNIHVNNNQIFIPRSVFCDLADLTSAEIKVGKANAEVTLSGGDASESYIVRIEFDENGISRRVLLSALNPEQPLQITTYYKQVAGDH